MMNNSFNSGLNHSEIYEKLLEERFDEKTLERFLKYVKIDTTSDPNCQSAPSTKIQFDLANVLVEELKSFGINNAHVDDKSIVMAHIPSNLNQSNQSNQSSKNKMQNKIPKIGFIAHLDTSCEVSGKDVNPTVIKSYEGGDIILKNGTVIRESESQNLSKCLKHTIITSDGNTLLGSDDKAGIASIMTALEYLYKHPEIPHGEIRVAFTPDEEIGLGVVNFDVKKFDADFAYTVDGGFTINMETFSADSAEIIIKGKNIHPGKAKNVMVNAVKVSTAIVSRLPLHMSPETTDKYQPYIHPHVLEASVDQAKLKLLFRSFDDEGLIEQKKIIEGIISEVSKIYPEAKLELNVTPTYRNMKKRLLEDAPKALALLQKATADCGLEIEYTPIRGGTDGSGLTAMGLPTPNIFYGGDNAHAVTEWQSLDYLLKSTEVILKIIDSSRSLHISKA
ncbi:MAG: peptidase T [Oligoflexia bacterium]|nr:peptidase T [Oligoflexia bacterium]